MDFGELWVVVERGGLPGALAVGTAAFLYFYLKGDRSKPDEPEWARMLANRIYNLETQIGRLRSETRETKTQITGFARSCEVSSDRAHSRIDSLHALVVEIRAIIGR